VPKRSERSRLKQDLRNTETKRETDIRNSLGEPSPGSENPKVTPESDVFKEKEEPKPQ